MLSNLLAIAFFNVKISPNDVVFQIFDTTSVAVSPQMRGNGDLKKR
jgi:hypothetical protein